jgi:DNA topoisomerase-1
MRVASGAALQERAPSKAVVEAVERGPRARWWRRRGSKKRGFWYEDASGKRITDEEQLARIRALAIPPAWTHVRVAPSPRSRLQAVGVDTSGRIQYKYDAKFAARQQLKKYEKVVRFGERLPHLRRRTNEDIQGEELTRERVLAVVIRLINDLYFRVGSEASVKRYRTYGVTTLRNRHLTIKGRRLIFSFVGKHHIRHRRIVVDEDLARLMRDIKALGGSRLFQYVDEEGKVRPIKPRDVNEYIKIATDSPEFSAKDFRTWGGTLLAAVELAEMGPPEDERHAKKNVVRAVKRVAEHLGNTPAVCRSCYIHPTVIDRYAEGTTLEEFRRRVERYARRVQNEYEPEEAALLKLVRTAG